MWYGLGSEQSVYVLVDGGVQTNAAKLSLKPDSRRIVWGGLDGIEW